MDRAAAVCVLLPKLLAAGFMFVDASPLPPAFNVTIILSDGLVVVYAKSADRRYVCVFVSMEQNVL